MRIERRSPLTGETNAMELDVTPEQVARWERRELLVQDAFPNLTRAEREFLVTGYTQEDWDAMFPPDEREG